MKTSSRAPYNRRSTTRFLNRAAIACVAVSLFYPLTQSRAGGQSTGQTFQSQTTDLGSSQSEFNRLPFRSRGAASANHPNRVKANLAAYSNPTSTIATPQDTSPPQDDPVRPMAKQVEVSAPTITFIDDIHLPAMESGVIKSMNVKEGDFVPARQLIGRIDDEMFQLALVRAQEQYNIAVIGATDDISIVAAEKEHKLREMEAEAARKLGKTRSKPLSEVRTAIFQEEIAELKIAKAHQEKEKAIGERNLARAQMDEVMAKIRRHDLKADFDGYVIEVLKKQQEYVNLGEDVVRIARMDRLWVQGIVEIERLNPHEALNRPVTVRVNLARGETATFEGKIVNVALERTSSETFLVKAEIQNRPIEGHWTLQPNSAVEMTIHLDRGSAPENNSFGTAATSNK